MITLADIQTAARRIEGRVLRTPLRSSTWMASLSGGPVLLKLECLQPTFSYKLRGAFNAVLRLAETPGARDRAIVTASAGNHGRALAYAARAQALPLTVYAPAQAPRTKLDAIRALGADLRLCADYDEAERRAKAHGASEDALFISPYSHPDVIAGAGTVALEILADCPDASVILVPIGGGGLISGVALAAEGSGASVWGVEVEASHPFTEGLAAGRIVEIDVKPTLADGLAGNLDPDTVTFDIVRHHVPRILLVSERGLRDAITGLARNERLIVEGAGSAAVAALLSDAVRPSGGPVIAVVSGGNIDLDVFATLLTAES